MREAFSLFDKNGDEKISKEELGPVLRALGRNPTQADLDRMMAEADVDSKAEMLSPQLLCLDRERVGRGGGRDRQKQTETHRETDRQRDRQT